VTKTANNPDRSPGGERGENPRLLQHLRKLVGRDCIYLGKTCRLVELLEAEETLVLEIKEPLPPIQTDQYGQPAFRSNEVLHLPVFGLDHNVPSDELADLLAGVRELAGE
jgi:hypothetical protein